MSEYKVVQLSSVHPSHDTRIFHKISKSLAANNFVLDLVIQHPRNEVKEGVNIVALPEAKKKLDRLTKVLPKLLSICIKYPKKTIFHFHDPELIIVGFLLKLKGCKVIYDVHEDVPGDISCKPWIPKYLRIPIAKIASVFEKLAVIFFDLIIVVDKNGKDRLDSKKTHLVQNFPILKKATQDKYNSRGNLFYVGDISEIRGAYEMIDCVQQLNKETRLTLAGKFSPATLEDELKEKEGWNKTDFVGWINRVELDKYLSESSIGLLLLYPEPHHVRSQPNKLFEYMYGGIPVVSANLPRYKEIIDEVKCGLVVDPKNIREIVDAVTWLQENPIEAAKMGERGKNAVYEKYNWTIEESKLLDLYENLTSNK